MNEPPGVLPGPSQSHQFAGEPPAPANRSCNGATGTQGFVLWLPLDLEVALD